jgi:MFS transporter, PAT family, beta-lactamase induction signal transducer AmpG
VFTRTSARRIGLLFLLYFVQGLPAGFQGKPLRAYLTQSGVSLSTVGFAATTLSLPWFCKALWAPLVDRFGSRRFGQRKSWIVPLQLLLAATCALAAFVHPDENLRALLGLVFLMNLLAATQDIAVDGLAIDLLGHGELGPANAVQVVGFKVGILVTGGLLLTATEYIGFQGYFGVMVALVLGVLIAVLPFREPPPSIGLRLDKTVPEATAPPERGRSLVEVVAVVVRALRVPGTGWLLLFIGTYKLGESMVDLMFTPFLIKSGFTLGQIGLWVGTYGLAASIAGSIAGGLLARRIPLLTAVGVTALLRSISMIGHWLLAAYGPTPSGVIVVTVAEHFFGGALTTAMFAFMMFRVDKSVSATHYTVLASVEVLGKLPGGWLSGVLAERLGFSRLFALGTALSFAFLLTLAPLRRRPAQIRA